MPDMPIKQPKCFSKSGKKGRLLKHSMMAGASALTLTAGVVGDAQAVTCAANTTSIGGGFSCTGPVTWTLGSGTLTNSGTISGGSAGVAVAGPGHQLDTITNNGTIIASGTGIQVFSSAKVGPIINNGLLKSPTGSAIAVFAGTQIGTLTNTGVIFGRIINRTSGELVIVGVTDGSDNYGTFTSDTITRTIESTVAGIRFAAGNSLIDMNMNVRTQTLTNAGASLKFINNRTLTGNFSQTSGNLVFGALSASSFPKLTVSGIASLTGGNIVLVPVSGGTSAGSYTILSAAGGVTSSANAIAAGYTVATSVVGGNTLVLTLTLAPIDNGGGNDAGGGSGGNGGGPVWTIRATDAGGNAVPIGPVLDALTADGNFTSLLAALTALPAASQNTALRQLGAPTLVTHAVAGGASFALSTSAIDQRQMSLLAGQPRSKAAGSAADGSGVWGQILGNHASLNNTASSDGFHASAYGLTMGADTHLTNDLVGGGAFSWLHDDLTDEDNSNGNNSNLNSYQLAAYGTWRPGGNSLFFNGILSVGRNNYSQLRAIDFLGTAATASYRGWQGQIKLGTGYDFLTYSGFTVTPVASLQAARVENDGYQESGAGVANMTVNKQGFNNVESELGVKLTAYTDTRLGRLIGDWQTGWLHSFTNKAVATTATMGGVNFVTTTDRLAKDGAHIVLRGTLQRTDNLSFSLEYDGTARKDFRSQTATVKMHYYF